MATKNMSRKMVNGVPMATVYRGMSVHRLQVLMNLFMRADIDCDEIGDGTAEDLEERFQRMCERAARKSEYNSQTIGVGSKKRKGK